MARKFDCFIIFAEMRTGSNFLESNLDQFPGLQCYGEAFNPYFMVTPKTEELFGVTVQMRDSDPMSLLARMKEQTDGIPGFRFFHDHDPRVFEALIDDPNCAKVVLTRNILDAYASRRIALATNQWQLNDAKDVIKKKARFIPSEFEKLFYRMKGFQLKIKDRLQRSGQTAFYIDYEDAQQIDVINGLAKFLGEDTEITEFAATFKKQNPEPIAEKVHNFELLTATVGRLDVFGLQRVPNLEPSRLPALKSYVASEDLGLVFLPIGGGPTAIVTRWMNDCGAVARDFTQKSLRQWKRQHKSHRTFTVLRHPVARLHSVFCDQLLGTDEATHWELKHVLRETYNVHIPNAQSMADWDRQSHLTAFLNFIAFVDTNLKGQTGIPVDAMWASQAATVQGFAGFALPDRLLREEQLEDGLNGLLKEVGVSDQAVLQPEMPDAPFALGEIYNEDVEAAVRKTYQRDYMMFGFKPWDKQD